MPSTENNNSASDNLLITSMSQKGQEIIEHLESEGVSVRFSNLKIADYIIAGRFAIVRRTLDDFMADLSNKMIYRTAPEFKRNFHDPLYVVEGFTPGAKISASTTGRAGITYLTIMNRIPIIFTNSAEETARYIALIMKQAEYAPVHEEVLEDEDDSQTKLMQPSEETSNGNSREPEDYKIKSLCALPGITEEAAEALVKKFGSLRSIITADENALRKVKGVGPKRAKTLQNAINAGARKEKRPSGNRRNSTSRPNSR